MAHPQLNTLAGLVSALLAGNRRALARIISHIEDNTALAQPLLAALYPRAGQAHIIGITGAPGTGKSTLVNGLAGLYRQRRLSVGIIAVDPTSPFSGGALLGDRVRMRDLAGDPGVFIRSMATRGSLGGLAQATADVIMVLDAAGFERIIIETVGVGQSEVEIASTAYTTVVVEAPGLGDEVQAIKAGVLEIADIFAVNKADREGADRTVMALKMMLNLGIPDKYQIMHHGRMLPVTLPLASAPDQQWIPPVYKTVATQKQGISELLEGIEEHHRYLVASGRRQLRSHLRAATELRMILRDTLLDRVLAELGTAAIDAMVHAVAQRQIDPYTAVKQWVAAYNHRPTT
ncbi:MAG: methylmalonyl Co-A mutase-associated GTPase MeaB [Chloroflexi bacterium]|nr:methylmalonyl Co-A mutase-associated GTPase MeaB [Chloroflexota bacterium]